MVLLSNGTNISRIGTDRHEQTLKGTKNLLSDWTSIPTVKDGGEVLIFGAIEDKMEWEYLVRYWT